MKYIDLTTVLASIPTSTISKLQVVDASMQTKTNAKKEAAARNGNVHWTPLKVYLEAASNRKCWYTESKNAGFINDVEHFRPKGKKKSADKKVVHWYWFLAFNPINYRLSSALPNRENKNPLLGATGGKHDHFPLLDGTKHATRLAEISQELPVLLDPCNRQDVELLVFLSDGRPVISPEFSNNATAQIRVKTSNLLLNLDYPNFNEDREQLYNKIKYLVERGDRYLADNSSYLPDVISDLRALFHPDAEYSKAAECYVRCFRNRNWIDEMF